YRRPSERRQRPRNGAGAFRRDRTFGEGRAGKEAGLTCEQVHKPTEPLSVGFFHALGVHAVINIGKQIVPPFDLGEPAFVDFLPRVPPCAPRPHEDGGKSNHSILRATLRNILCNPSSKTPAGSPESSGGGRGIPGP